MLELRAARVDDPLAHALLTEYFAMRVVGFTDRVYNTVFPDPAKFTPPAGVFLIAELDGEPVGCAGIRMLSPERAELKHLYVRDSARGRGVGGGARRRARAARRRVRRDRDGARHPRQPRGRGAPLRARRATSRSSPTTTTRTRATGTEGRQRDFETRLRRSSAPTGTSRAGRPRGRCAARAAGARGRCGSRARRASPSARG